MQMVLSGVKDFFLWAGAMLFLYISIVAINTLLFFFFFFFFLWAGAMLFLYISIVAFITLLFGYIDYVFPNSLNYYPSNPYDNGISYQMAMLIVLVPLFL